MKGRSLLSGLLLLWTALAFGQGERETVDSEPHKSGFVLVNGIKLHYLDWGGNGEPLLLLTGLGNDAHVFDGFASNFVDAFRVIALTRRGFGESDVPATGYDTASRVEDIRGFLDALHIRQANVAGHSMAGGEMTLLASLYPERIRKLIYLDAAYDSTCSAGRALDPWASKFTQRLDAELRNPDSAPDIPVENLPAPAKWEAIKATVRATDSFHPDYSRVNAPSLAIYAPPERYPDAPRGAPADARSKMDEWWMKNRSDCAAKSIDQFRRGMQQGRVEIIKNGYHYLFLGIAQREVVRLTREFLLQDNSTDRKSDQPSNSHQPL